MKRRRTKITGSAKVDRISRLPDNILCHILAFLPTRSAVATCVLSQRWKYVWTGIPVLDFTEPPQSIVNSRTLTADQYISFKNFMNRILLLNHISCLERVDLDVYDIFKSNHLYEWFTVLGRRSIKELNIFGHFQRQRTELPMILNDMKIEIPMMSLFTGLASERIVVLRLSAGLCLSLLVTINATIHLPSLEVLHCREVTFKAYDDGDDPVGYLLSGCPALRELVIANCKGVRRLSICCSSLKILEVSLEQRSRISPTIRVPNVEFLALYDNLDDYEIDELPSLVEAKISISAQKSMKHIQRMWRAKTLCLRSNINIWFFPIHNGLQFHNLKRLEVTQSRLPIILGVVRMLRFMPNLASLILNMYLLDHETWSWPDAAAGCGGLRLKYMELCFDMGSEVQITVMVYCFLSLCCMPLKEMKFRLPPLLSLEDKYEVLKTLMKLPRASNCALTICWDEFF